jgi:hypothetical protein
MRPVYLSLAIGLVFSPIAAIMAFLIAYEEYSRHYADKKTPAKLSLEAGAVAFAVFILISLLVGLVI